MKIYLVGGAVRDKLLNREFNELDYLVVGGTPKELLDLGHIQVGKAFPVFLHPKTKDEYALARKEKKVRAGHQGFEFEFSPDITLEEDLIRRDLTINAIVQDLDSKEIIDPLGGLKDIKNKVLRHISDHFTEDPLRVLRVARFKAQLPDFSIANETLELMKTITQSGELESLSGERIFRELQKALSSNAPHLFFEALKEVGALKILFKEISDLDGIPQPPKYHPEGDALTHTLLVLKASATYELDLKMRFACLVHDLGKANYSTGGHKGHELRGLEILPGLCDRVSIPKTWRDFAYKVTKYHFKSHIIDQITPSEIYEIFREFRAFNDPKDFKTFLDCCECDNQGKLNNSYPQKEIFETILEYANRVSPKDIAKEVEDKSELPKLIEKAYLTAIQKAPRSLKQ